MKFKDSGRRDAALKRWKKEICSVLKRISRFYDITQETACGHARNRFW